MYWLSLSLLSLVPLGLAKPVSPRWNDLQVKHEWYDVPKGWVPVGTAPEGTTIDLRIKLKSHDEGALHKALYEVSDPAHERYGAHLSKEEVAALVAPHQDTHDAVSAWLAHHDIPASSVRPSLSGDWLMIADVPVDTADALLGASYQLYSHEDTQNTVLRTTSYSLPAVLHEHVAVVAPTTYFGSPRPAKATSHVNGNAATIEEDSAIRASIDSHRALGSLAVPSSCANTITPACLKALYNTTGYTPKATAKNVLGVAGYLDEYASHSDLTKFASRFLTGASSAAFTVKQINGGGDDQSNPGSEANLDIQYTTGLSFPTPQIYYSTGGSPPFNKDENTPTNSNEPYLDFLDYLLAQSTIPQTLTTSYGDDEQTVPRDYALNVCNLFAQLGAQGTTVLFSSGDSGVGSDCVTNDGKSTRQFLPAFPASCPFVTAVGGTTGIKPERAASLSGGGFSNYFARPSYQDKVVPAFVSSIGTLYSGLYNTSGRAYPDVSAQAEGFQIVIDGSVASVDGTSASSPTVAGVVSLLNDYRLSQGKSALGFLNPLLYASASAGFNDITSGTNPGCNTNGFTAVKGWDPVTGFGTPNFGKLQSLV